MALNTDYPYDGFNEMYPQTEPTPEWYGFGHKHLAYHKTPMTHLVLADGQQYSEIDVQDPDEPLDYAVADIIRGQPAERYHYPVSTILTLDRTVRPGARPGMETGQFQAPNSTPGLLAPHTNRLRGIGKAGR